jgi:hypothetical protein
MQEIQCPHCGKAFTIDEAGYAAILQQVRDREFNQELARQTESAVKLSAAEKDAAIAELKSKLDAAEVQKTLAVREAADRQQEEIRALRDRLTAAEAEKTLAVQAAERKAEQARFEKDRELLELHAALEKQEAEFRLQKQQSDTEQALILKQKDEEIAFYKDMKARMSTKMVGETLEQHCEIEFNRLRAAAFPNAYFEKDNDVRTGTKGDYIFRDYDENGAEYISIMFEMKNEMDTTATKHRNEDFLKKLDKDRTDKGCEYAVLVTLLESESELYNTGIVDMSYRYPKMYVIRPQFFIPIISLLRNAAQSSLDYRRQLVAVQNQHVDVETFNQQLQDFKERFSRDYRLASERFNDAIEEIDKSIARLQKVKEALLKSGEHLRHADAKAEELTVKRLTRGNETMKEMFRDAGIDVT